MKNKVLTILLGIGLVAVIGGSFVLYNFLGEKVESDSLKVEESIEETEKPEVKEDMSDEKPKEDKSEYTKAFDFTVYDENGNPYKLSEFEGKPVVLNFWASWCGPCKSEMPEFETAYQTYGENIHFLMVNLTDGYQESVESAKGFIEKSGYTFPIYYDTSYDAAKAYSVYAVPVTYFLDEDGYIIAWGNGALSAEKLKEGIGFIYSE